MEDSLDTNFSSSDEDMRITAAAKDFLAISAKWANFLAIVGFVMLGILVIGALFMVGAAAQYSGYGGGPSLGLLAVVYLLMAVLYFFPTYYLYLFAKKIKVGLQSSSEEDVTLGFENLKSMFKFMGILMIVVLSLYALMFLMAIAAGSASMF
ncbi:MAG: DUF5362 family protein [Crocinitomicaceae bacterium]|nr:DUF5362 family protein [Crocinitomicaceae bacterium]